jgi:hypothetical protein
VATQGQVPRASTKRDYVVPTQPIQTELNSTQLPTAFGAYVGKVEDKAESFGKKKPRTLTELIACGFRLVPWNGMYAMLFYYI